MYEDNRMGAEKRVKVKTSLEEKKKMNQKKNDYEDSESNSSFSDVPSLKEKLKTKLPQLELDPIRKVS